MANWLVLALIFLIAVFLMLGFLAIFSRPLRGVAVAFLSLMLMACVGFLLVATFVSYRQTRVYYQDVKEQRMKHMHHRMYVPIEPQPHPYNVIETYEGLDASPQPTVESVADLAVIEQSAETVEIQQPAETQPAETQPAETQPAETQAAQSSGSHDHAHEDHAHEDHAHEDHAHRDSITTATSGDEPAAVDADKSPESASVEATAEITEGESINPLLNEADPLLDEALATSFVDTTDRRPDWLKSPPQKYEGHPAEVISSEAFVTRYECEDDLDRRLRTAIAEYVKIKRRYAGGPAIRPTMIGGAEIQMASRDQYVEMFDTSVGTMKRIHQLVVFDDDLTRKLEDKVARLAVQERLVQAGATSGGVVLLIAAAFGLLKITTRSRNVA